MNELAVVLWAVLGVLFIVAEVFTAGFFLLWFGVAALAAALAGVFGFGLAVQFVVFLAVAVALIALSRTIFVRYFGGHQDTAFKTGVDSLPGQIGMVTAASRGAMNAAEVKVFGSTWTAYPIDDTIKLGEGERVEVVRVSGASVYVRRIGELPEWRQTQKSTLTD